MRNVAANLALSLCSFLVTFVLLEIGWRAYDSEPLQLKHFLKEKLDLLFARKSYVEFDDELGWVPRAGIYKTWGRNMAILGNGLRSNGGSDELARPQGPFVLAVGDSFTFGDGVADPETWPAGLERRVGVRVLNAGVPGYGLDQTVLRAESLLRRLSPDLLIVGLIGDDIHRCNLSTRGGVFKPYFDVTDDELQLRNHPVPAPLPRLERLDRWRRWLGYSYLVHALMLRLNEQYWMEGTNARVSVHKGMGEKISCLLFERLTRLALSTPTKTMVLFQYPISPSQWERNRNQKVAECISAPVVVLDLYDALHEKRQDDPEGYARMFRGHMTRSGNDWVAERVARFLTERQLMDVKDP